jgi:hypothetical protein
MERPPTYAGIGSRRTPDDVLELMREIGRSAHEAGWRLRSGAAQGADQAFAHHSPGAETYLPWPTYEIEALRALPAWPLRILPSPSVEAVAQVDRWHPAADHLSQGARKLHARNHHIVMGRRLDDPVRAIICWTPGGKESGGTGGALRIAAEYQIPVLNLAAGASAAEAFAWLQSQR